MTFGELEAAYKDARDKINQVDILADLNDMKSTEMAMILQEMGLDIPSQKLPRAPRNGGEDKRETFKRSEFYAGAKEYREAAGREIGKAVVIGKGGELMEAAVTEEPAAVTETPAAVTETPAAVTETTAAVTETTAAVTETTAAVTETTAAVTETPAAVTETKDTGEGTKCTDTLAMRLWRTYLESKYGAVPFDDADLEAYETLRAVAERIG